MVIPTYNRTLEEFEAPFGEGSFAGLLQLESSSEVVLDDPYWSEFQQSGDADAFAHSYADFFRAAYAPSLFGELDSGRSSEERESISGEFLEKLRSKVSEDPATAACTWHVVLMLNTRKSGG